MVVSTRADGAVYRLVANFLTPIAGSMRKAEKQLGPIIRDRLEKENRHGKDWPGKPVSILNVKNILPFIQCTE